MMFWEGLTAISAQKHFQIKFINIAIYCNNFFDIAIYRNTFLGPQYPALPQRTFQAAGINICYHILIVFHGFLCCLLFHLPFSVHRRPEDFGEVDIGVRAVLVTHQTVHSELQDVL